MRYLIAMMAVLVVAGCGPKLEERVKETHPDGTPRHVQYFQGEGEDRFVAREIFYYPNGNKRMEGTFNEAKKKHGKWTYWYEDGTKWSEGYFHNGLNDGKRITWHENGQKHYEGHYDKGTRIGVWKFYSEEGKVLKEIDYDKGEDKP